MSAATKFKMIAAIYAAGLPLMGAISGPGLDIAVSIHTSSNQAGAAATQMALSCTNPNPDVGARAYKLITCPMAAGAQMASTFYTPFTGSPGSARIYQNLADQFKPATP
jgi:hypothetical protein